MSNLIYDPDSAGNNWEPHPVGCQEAVWKAQMARFESAAGKPLEWVPITDEIAVNLQKEVVRELGVTYFATYQGENYILIDNIWYGFPDPPRWRIARNKPSVSSTWSECGYFRDIPKGWSGIDRG